MSKEINQIVNILLDYMEGLGIEVEKERKVEPDFEPVSLEDIEFDEGW